MILKNTRQSSKKLKIFSQKLFKYFLLFGLTLGIAAILLKLDFIKIHFLKQKVAITPSDDFFSQSVEIELTSPLKNADIYYTLDGSDPTKEDELYSQPIRLEKTTVLKLGLFKNDQLQGSIQTKDVFINTSHQLAVVSLSTDPKNLFDPTTGIYHKNNFEKKGKEWERPATISFYEPNKEKGFTREIRIRLHGGGSKSLPQKSFRVLISNEENNQTLKYPLFPDNKVQTFNGFILRNAGGDWSHTHLRDALVQEIIQDADLNLDLQDYRPVVLYLNGEYWGLYNLRELQDEFYYVNKYKADSGRINIYEVPHDVGDIRGQIVLTDGDDADGAKLYNRLLEETRRCKGCTNTDYLSQYLDLINFRNYTIFEFHFGNYDWPYGNFKTWRYLTNAYEPKAPAGLDGRFRWSIFDFDVAFGFGEDTKEDMQESAKGNSYGRLIDDKFPFRNLLYDPIFMKSFLNEYADLLNTTLKYENVAKKIDKLAAAITPEMSAQIEKWHNRETWGDLVKNDEIIAGTHTLESFEDWQNEIELLKVRAKWRPEYMKQNTLETFDLTGMSQIILDSNQPEWGTIQINSITIPKDELPWSGEYFNTLKVEITAIPSSGHRFVGWEGDQNSSEKKLKIGFDSDTKLKAIFK